MVQIGRRGTERRLFENFKKFSKIKKKLGGIPNVSVCLLAGLQT